MLQRQMGWGHVRYWVRLGLCLPPPSGTSPVLGTLEAEVEEAEVVAGFWDAAGQPSWSRSLPDGGYAYPRRKPKK